EAELQRAITLAEAEHAFQSETAEGRARLYGRAETVWRLAEELAYIDRVRTVTAEQVRLVARRYLDPERYGRIAFVPPRWNDCRSFSRRVCWRWPSRRPPSRRST